MNSNWKTLALFILVFVYTTSITWYISGPALEMNIDDVYKNSLMQLLKLTFIEFLLTLFIVWLFCTYIDKKKIDMGLQRFDCWKLLGLFLICFLIISFGFCFLLLIHQVKIDKVSLNIRELILSFGIFVLIAFTEELVVRGYILNKLFHLTTEFKAIGISALIFSLLHSFNPEISWFALTSLFGSGILLGLLYNYTKSLWCPIVFHFSWNFFQGPIFGFPVGGLPFKSILHQRILDDNILTGGLFGFEASIFGILCQLILILFLVRFSKKRLKQYPNNSLLRK